MSLTEISPNNFTSTNASKEIENLSAPTIIYLIPGNPGLISYYHTFLSLLTENLSCSRSKNLQRASASSHTDGEHDLHHQKNQNPNSGYYLIHGRSLGGFELEEERKPPPSNSNFGLKEKKAQHRQDWPPSHLFNLNEQIRFVEQSLSSCVRRWREMYQPAPLETGNGEASTTTPKVILIGHSVGAYIAMEIIRRQRERLKSRSNGRERRDCDDDELEGEMEEMDIISVILLFPTVVDIAKSSSGRVLTTLLYIPYLALLASLITKFMVLVLPETILSFIVRLVMRFPPEHAVNTTLGLLKSRSGVCQALHMAADEMRQITSDKWSDEIWGITSSSPSSSVPDSPLPQRSSRSSKLAKLFLYFGRKDHWVADQTRDEIIRARGNGGAGSSRAEGKGNGNGNGNGPSIVVCEDDVPHGFCIRHNDIMARKVGDFIKELDVD